jgi:uncharacterized protein
MPVSIILLLLVAGFLGGIANTMAGGASLFTFPALLFAGLPPIVANASNAMAVTSGNAAGFLTDLKSLPRTTPAFWISLVIAVLGGGLGALLLLVTPEKTFTQSVPILIGLATLIFAFSKSIQRGLSRIAGGGSEHARLRLALLFPTALYSGFFGAGAGVIILSILSATSNVELRRLNVVKNLYSFLCNLSAIGFFIWFGMISWPATLLMMLGTMLGGYTGIKLTHILPATTVRTVIMICGVTMTIIYAYRYWF